MYLDLILGKRFLNDQSLELHAIRRFDERIFLKLELVEFTRAILCEGVQFLNDRNCQISIFYDA